MLDVGVSQIRSKPRIFQGRKGPLRLLWSGYFGHHKALQLLLRALARLPADFNFELRVLGDGPLENSWRALAVRLGVADSCTWTGWLRHEDAMKQYSWADVFVFTSLRDTCGTVVLEALGQGLPVICLDHQGAGSVVTEECGFKVAVTSSGEVVRGLTAAIVDAGTNDEQLERLSRGALARAEGFLWHRHGLRLAEIYEEVCKKFVLDTDTGK
jgi:glycosyltransferase involved in cell wall biosynthesis